MPPGRTAPDARALFHAWVVRRFGAPAARDPVELRKPRLLSLKLLDGRPTRMRECFDILIPAPAHPLRTRLYVPETCTAPAPALVFLHFGGGVIGDLETSHTACSLLAQHARCKVLSVEYRLAPEHRFPAALQDAIMAFRWLRQQAEQLGIAQDRIGIGGDSAGGCLAAATSLFLRDKAEPMPCVQLLMYPVVEMDRANTPGTEFDDCYPLSRADMIWFASHYVGDPSDAADPLCSIGRAVSLAGLPPTLFVQAGYDLLFEEGSQFIHRLEADGVPVLHRVYPSLPHAFSAMTGGLPEARSALIETAGLLGRALREPGKFIALHVK